MIYLGLDEMAQIAAPTALYLAYLKLRRRRLTEVFRLGPLMNLTSAGLLTVIAVMVWRALEVEGGPQAKYEPAHLEGGTVVPGKFHP